MFITLSFLFMDYIGTDGYENAEEVCGEYNFKTKDDVEEYIQKAADYVATKYKIDLEYNIYDEEEQFEIVFSDSDKILIKGYWDVKEVPTIHTFSLEDE